MAREETYRNTRIMTASPMELILILYKECIVSLQRAEDAFDLEDTIRFQEISNNILHAEDIITELSLSLNMEQGGAIANNLYRLYDFMIRHLSEANLKKIKQPISEVRKLMMELQESWQQVEKQHPQNHAGYDDKVSSEAGKISLQG